jgi:N-acyl-D-amino-acid deacylase
VVLEESPVAGRDVLRLAPLALAFLVLAETTNPRAQSPGYVANPYTDRGSAYNPYTGRGGVDRSGYNPYTRTTPQAAAGYNPLTGANPGAVAPANPYTGASPGTYNPMTGRYGRRGEQRSPPGSYRRAPPVTGKAGPGLEKFDEVMLAVLEKHGIPGGALAIVKDGRLVLARGYGWGNLATGAPVTPDAVFGVASLSKSLTAAAVLKLVEQGKLSLEDRAFRLLSHLKPALGDRADPRLDSITVRQLLNHTGGWDRNKSGEPWGFSWRVARRLRVPLPITVDQLIRYMLGQRLDFTPGTESQYSNFGYMVLGQIIEKVTGLSYGDYLSGEVLKPMGLHNARLPGRSRGYHDDEVRLYSPGTYQLVSSDFLGQLGDAAGSWRSSAVDLARFLAALDGSRGKPFLSAATRKEMLADPPPPIKTTPGKLHVGLGWDAVATKKDRFGYFKDGLLPGTRAFMGRTPAGVNYVLLFNSGERITPRDITSEMHPRHGVEKSIADTIAWPKVDYFDSFR